jgi:hypothetical protein
MQNSQEAGDFEPNVKENAQQAIPERAPEQTPI